MIDLITNFTQHHMMALGLCIGLVIWIVTASLWIKYRARVGDLEAKQGVSELYIRKLEQEKLQLIERLRKHKSVEETTK